MDKKSIMISIDNEADILLIARCESNKDQICQFLSDDIVVRLNPESQKIELIQILNFSERFAKSDVFELPIVADFFICNGKSSGTFASLH